MKYLDLIEAAPSTAEIVQKRADNRLGWLKKNPHQIPAWFANSHHWIFAPSWQPRFKWPVDDLNYVIITAPKPGEPASVFQTAERGLESVLSLPALSKFVHKILDLPAGTISDWKPYSSQGVSSHQLAKILTPALGPELINAMGFSRKLNKKYTEELAALAKLNSSQPASNDLAEAAPSTKEIFARRIETKCRQIQNGTLKPPHVCQYLNNTQNLEWRWFQIFPHQGALVPYLEIRMGNRYAHSDLMSTPTDQTATTIDVLVRADEITLPTVENMTKTIELMLNITNFPMNNWAFKDMLNSTRGRMQMWTSTHLTQTLLTDLAPVYDVLWSNKFWCLIKRESQ